MQYDEYLQQSRELLSCYNEYLCPNADKTFLMQFTLVSAGLKNFLPALPESRYLQIFKGIHLHQQLSVLEQCCDNIADHINYLNLTPRHWHFMQRGCIICTFHTGSYRSINLLLTNHDISFALVVSDKMYRAQGEELLNLYQNHSRKDAKEFVLINAEAPGAFLTMIRQLKTGKTLVVYADGNTGLGMSNHQNKNCSVVPFLSQQLYARTGIAYLSAITGATILPVVSYRSTIHDIYMEFYDPIENNPEIDRETGCGQTTRYLYQILAKIVQSYPEQWEAWLYLHNMIHIAMNDEHNHNNLIRPLKPSERLYFNSDEFGIFREAECYFLFRKAGFLSYPVDETIYYLLLNATYTPVSKKRLNKQVFKELFENKVLVGENTMN